ncbi:hypothetical protein TELCIR_12451, partial [Teladorsagia circumcincta]
MAQVEVHKPTYCTGAIEENVFVSSSFTYAAGLSRAPIIEPANFIPYTAPIEGVSARAPSVSNRTTNFGKLVASSSPPPSPKAERRSRVRSASETTPTCVAQPEQVVSKPNKKLLNKSNEEAHPKKSCLTKTTQSVIPARLNLRKKTVAFGKTVNVSQTIEGTSRLSKQKQAMNKSMQSKEVVATNTENKENEPEESSGVNKEQTALLDILKDVKSSLDVLKARDEERADELRNIRRLVDERGKEVDLLRGMFADYLGKDCPQSSDSKVYSLTKREEDRYRPNANRDKFSRNPSPQCRSKRLYSPPPRNATKVDPQRDSDSEEIDGITFEEFKRLLTTNPTLRQFVLDIRHEENDKNLKTSSPCIALEKVSAITRKGFGNVGELLNGTELWFFINHPKQIWLMIRNAGDLNDSDVEDERTGRKYGGLSTFAAFASLFRVPIGEVLTKKPNLVPASHGEEVWRVMPCSLFVPTVKGSRQCAVCQCSLDDHRLTAIFVEPSKVFTAPNTPATQRKEA